MEKGKLAPWAFFRWRAEIATPALRNGCEHRYALHALGGYRLWQRRQV
jgi:hypothetical protein